MLGSDDGPIKQDIFGLKDPPVYFEEIDDKIKSDNWLVGRVTMQEFSSKEQFEVGKGLLEKPYRDFIAQQPAPTVAVVIDPSGKRFWNTHKLSTQNAFEVLTER